jgi:hypothetical protein
MTLHRLDEQGELYSTISPDKDGTRPGKTGIPPLVLPTGDESDPTGWDKECTNVRGRPLGMGSKCLSIDKFLD